MERSVLDQPLVAMVVEIDQGGMDEMWFSFVPQVAHCIFLRLPIIAVSKPHATIPCNAAIGPPKHIFITSYAPYTTYNI